jgi:TonB-linked SusC/RagA family outer membrane protein
MEPLGTVYNADGSLNLFPLNGTLINPLADEQPGVYARNTKTTRTTASAYVELAPVKGLTIRSTFGAIFSSAEAGSFYGKNTIDGKAANSASSVTNTQTRNTSWETVATYKKEIERHSFTITGVASNLSNSNTSSYGGGNNQPFPSNLYYNIGSNTANLFLGSGYGADKLISFTGRINYSYDGKYLLTLTGRNDGSSKLAPGHKWSFFPSAALGWRIIEEKFMKEQKIFSELKLRGSYGISGNDVIQPYGTQDLLTSVLYSYNDGNSVPAFTITPLIGNPLLKWETTATKNIGVDFGVLRNRITGTIDYYDAVTSDLISNYILPLSTGVGSVNRNFGKTRNQGIEIGINSRNISNKNGFTWSSSLTFTRNKEKIMELPNGNAIADDYRNSLIIGQASSIFYDYKKIGIWQLGEEVEAAKYNAVPGDIKVADLSGADGKPDGKITGADRTIIGNRVPAWTGGLGNDLAYKGFDLNIFVFARIGQWISSDYYAKYNRNGGDNGAKVDYWTPENPTNEYPRPYLGRTLLYATTLTERKASFVKIRNITLGYTLPKSFISRAKIENIRVYVSGRNLHTFSSVKDFDPEGGGVIDRPLNRLYTAGINVTF